MVWKRFELGYIKRNIKDAQIHLEYYTRTGYHKTRRMNVNLIEKLNDQYEKNALLGWWHKDNESEYVKEGWINWEEEEEEQMNCS